MKFHTLALATALTFGGAAFAAPSDTAKAPAAPETTHAVKVNHHVTRHAARHASSKHHLTHMAKRHHMHQGTAPSQTDVNSGSRQDRMDAALRKFRTAHS